VAIRDDGPGFDPEEVLSAGGLSGMRERVQLAGGTLTVDAAPGQGVVVTAELPLPDGNEDADS
jgi:signal transduction histidine kinase